MKKKLIILILTLIGLHSIGQNIMDDLIKQEMYSFLIQENSKIDYDLYNYNYISSSPNFVVVDDECYIRGYKDALDYSLKLYEERGEFYTIEDIKKVLSENSKLWEKTCNEIVEGLKNENWNTFSYLLFRTAWTDTLHKGWVSVVDRDRQDKVVFLNNTTGEVKIIKIKDNGDIDENIIPTDFIPSELKIKDSINFILKMSFYPSMILQSLNSDLRWETNFKSDIIRFDCPDKHKLEKFYQNMISQGVTEDQIGSFDEWYIDMADDQLRSKFYDDMINNNLFDEKQLGSKSSFENRIKVYHPLIQQRILERSIKHR